MVVKIIALSFQTQKSDGTLAKELFQELSKMPFFRPFVTSWRYNTWPILAREKLEDCSPQSKDAFQELSEIRLFLDLGGLLPTFPR